MHRKFMLTKPGHCNPRSRRLLVAACLSVFVLSAPSNAFADRLLMVDGTTLEVDDAWDDAEGVWYRRGGMTNFVERARVRTIERGAKDVVKSRQLAKLAGVNGGEAETVKTAPVVVERPLWIYL